MDQEEIKKLQEADPQYSELIKTMKRRNKTVNGDFSLDPQRVLYKGVQYHGKEFMALIVSKGLQNMCYLRAIID